MFKLIVLHFTFLAVSFTFAQEVSNALKQSCVVQTCGTAESLPNKSAPVTENHKVIFEQNIEPLLNKYIQQDLMLHDLNIFLPKKFANLKIDKISDKYMSLLNFMDLIELYEQNTPDFKVVGDKSVLDESTYRAKLAKSLDKDEDIEWLVKATKGYFLSEFITELGSWDDHPIEVFIKHQYPNKTMIEALRIEAKKLEKIRIEFAETIPMFAISSQLNPPELEKALKNEPLTTDEKVDFLNTRTTLLTFNELLPKGSLYPLFTSRKVNIQKMADTSIRNYVKKIASAPPSWAHATTDERDKLFASCKKGILESIASSPTLEENQKFRSVIENVRSEAQKITHGKISDVLSKTEFVLPLNKQENLSAITKNLISSSDEGNKMYRLILKLNPSIQEDKESAVFYMVMASKQIEEKYTALKKVAEFCDENKAAHIVDSAYTSYNIVNVGWRSVLYPEQGYGILAHELGHIVSSQKSLEDNFKKTKACLKENQGGKDNFVEEDFADLFAAKIVSRQPQNSKMNFGCMLIPQYSNQFTYLQMNANSEDSSHSSGFYRLIKIGMIEKNIKPDCEHVRQNTAEGAKMKDCWAF